MGYKGIGVSSSVLRLKAPVATYNDLPLTENLENDGRFTKDTDLLYTWTLASASGTLDSWKLVGAISTMAWANITDKPSSSVADIDDAVDKKHTQNSDTDLDATFEATFVKKTDTVNVLSDITSSGTDIEDAVTKKHAQNSDTDLDATFEATFMKKVDTVNELSDITSAGADIEDAVTKKHASGSDNETTTSMGTLINGADAKTTPVDTDLVPIRDTTGSLLEKVTWANIKATLKTYFDAIYNTAVKATGAEIDTGTDDAKFATSKALQDSSIPKGDGTVNPTNLLSNGNFESWSAGTAVAPDGWILSGLTSGAIAREATIIKQGTYSVKMTRSGTDGNIYQYYSVPKGITYWKGRNVTYGCWVYATEASTTRIGTGDLEGGLTYSSWHTGGSAWEWLTVTRTIDASASGSYCINYVVDTNTSSYFDGAMLVEGASAFAFSPKPITGSGNNDAYVYSNIAKTEADSAVAKITQDNAGASEPALEIKNDGTGAGIEIDQNGDGQALRIVNSGADESMYVNQTGVLDAGKQVLYLYSNAEQVNYNSALLLAQQDNAASSEPAIEVINAGTGADIEMAASGGGVIFPTNDPGVAGRWWDNAGTLTKSSG